MMMHTGSLALAAGKSVEVLQGLGQRLQQGSHKKGHHQRGNPGQGDLPSKRSAYIFAPFACKSRSELAAASCLLEICESNFILENSYCKERAKAVSWG